MIEKALSVKGYMSEPELQWLAERAVDAKVIVEIGCYYGRSTRALADNTEGKVYCIDPWPGAILNQYGKIAISSGNYVFQSFQNNLKDHINSGKVIVHRGTVKDFDLIDDADFIFIDGDHLKVPFEDDLEFAERLIKKGIISGHDYGNIDWPAVKQLVDKNYSKVNTEGFIWWTQK